MPENQTEQLDRRKKELEILKLEKENQKLEIEHEKLLLEKAELKKKWYQKPQWWSAFVPLIIGAGTIWIAFSTGIISVQRLTNQKENLEKNIVTLNQQIANKNASLIVMYKSEINNYNNWIDLMEGTGRTKEVPEIKATRDLLQKELDELKAQQK